MPARAIFLNGPSSSGKSTLARALQARLPEPFVHMAEDMFFSALPARPYPQEEFLRYGTRLYHGFAQCVRTLLACENHVVVDTVAWVPGSLETFVDALWDMPVLAVGLFAPLEVLEQREQERGDRPAGLARRQAEAVHQGAWYDLEIDVSRVGIDDAAERIVARLNDAPIPHAFARMKARREGAPEAP